MCLPISSNHKCSQVQYVWYKWCHTLWYSVVLFVALCSAASYLVALVCIGCIAQCSVMCLIRPVRCWVSNRERWVWPPQVPEHSLHPDLWRPAISFPCDMLTRHSNNLVTYWSQNYKRMYHIVYRVDLLNVFLLDIGHTRSYESLACATAYQSYQSSRCRFYSKIRMKKGLGAGPLSKYAWWLRLVFKRLRTPSLTMRFCWKAWA